MKLEITDITLGYGSKTILSHINLTVTTGDIVCLLGPNGAGKTTLFKAILGFLAPQSGNIFFDGKSVSQWNHRQFAQHIAYIPQAHSTPFPYSVQDVVLFGRTAHLGMFESPGKKDRFIADECIDLLGIAHLRNNSFPQLSGGEQQLVIIARALAQQPRFLVMDEPTSNLDFGNQVKVLKKINELKRNDMGILMSTHSPDHAFLCDAKALIIHQGNLVKYGDSESIITEKQLKNVYGVDVHIFESPQKDTVLGRKVCVPMI